MKEYDAGIGQYVKPDTMACCSFLSVGNCKVLLDIDKRDQDVEHVVNELRLKQDSNMATAAAAYAKWQLDSNPPPSPTEDKTKLHKNNKKKEIFANVDEVFYFSTNLNLPHYDEQRGIETGRDGRGAAYMAQMLRKLANLTHVAGVLTNASG
jgi:hypothetical protein